MQESEDGTAQYSLQLQPAEQRGGGISGGELGRQRQREPPWVVGGDTGIEKYQRPDAVRAQPGKPLGIQASE